jgi:carboxylesterase
VNTIPTFAPGGAPFYIPGSRIGCVLVHGFTGSPGNLRWLADHLYRELSCTIYAPRLAGHGTRPDDMHGIRWEEWYADVRSAFCLLREHCDQVFMVGLSLGAALSLLLAANESVSGVVAMSTPHAIYDWRACFLPLISLFMPMRAKQTTEDQREFYRYVEAEERRRGHPNGGYTTYETYSTASLMQVDKLLGQMRSALPRVTAPTLLIHSRRDDIVPFAHLDLTAQRIGCENKQTLILDRSLHVVTMDVECATVFDAVMQFITAQNPAA